jgi:chromosomal replication initiation ATPase DnaA
MEVKTYISNVGSITISMLNNAYRSGHLPKILMPELFSKITLTEEDMILSWFELLDDYERKKIIDQAVKSVLDVHDPDCNSRKHENVQYRQILTYFLKKKTKYPWTMIGRFLGNKDHATAINAYKKACNYIDTDPAYREIIDKVYMKIGIKYA